MTRAEITEKLGPDGAAAVFDFLKPGALCQAGPHLAVQMLRLVDRNEVEPFIGWNVFERTMDATMSLAVFLKERGFHLDADIMHDQADVYAVTCTNFFQHDRPPAFLLAECERLFMELSGSTKVHVDSVLDNLWDSLPWQECATTPEDNHEQG